MFSGVFKQLADANSAAAKSFQDNMQSVTLDTGVFKDQAKAAASVSPAALIATLARKSEASDKLGAIGAPGDALMKQLRDTVTNALEANRREGVLGSAADLFGDTIRSENLPGSFALSELQSAPIPLLAQRHQLIQENERLGGDPEIQAKIKSLSSTIQTIEETTQAYICLLYTSPSPRDKRQSRMPSSA